MEDLDEALEPLADEVRTLNLRLHDAHLDEVAVDVLSNGDLAINIPGQRAHYASDPDEAQDYIELYFGVEL